MIFHFLLLTAFASYHQNLEPNSKRRRLLCQNYLHTQLEPPTPKETQRYDVLPQDNYLKPRLHGMELFYAHHDGSEVTLNRLQQQEFFLSKKDREVDETIFDATEVRKFGPLPCTFLNAPHTQRAFENIIQMLPDEFTGRRFVVGIHAFKLRIDPTNPDLMTANATPEGVHQDGAKLVMINYIGAENVCSSSAKTYLWTLDQPNGPPNLDDPEQQQNIITQLRLCRSGECMFLLDEKIRHHVTEIYQADPHQKAFRKVLVLYARFIGDNDVIAPNTLEPCEFKVKIQ